MRWMHWCAAAPLRAIPLHGQVAAVSVGIVGGIPVIDLDYAEDSDAETDMNVVMNNGGAFIEVQGTAEGHAFRRHELDQHAGPRGARLSAALRGATHRPAGAARGRVARVGRVSAQLPARLVLATGNAGKLRELREILAPWRVEVLALSEFTGSAAVETGLTFVENALLKARFAAQAAGLPAIADDSGLEVNALGGAPGIRSARYAGEGADDDANNARLLRELAAVPDARRGARYRCAMAYVGAPGDRTSVVCEAGWEGRIATVPRGTGGFGYDPLFIVAGTGRTAAEFEPGEKNREQSPWPGAQGAHRRARRRRSRTVTAREAPPLSLYVHLPWCVRKCPYCDFNSHPVPSAGVPERAYLAALLGDLDLAARTVAGREIVSVFFGGGTPSLFSARAIETVLARLRDLLPVAGDAEVTLEANPGTVEHGAFAAYREAGVNRVSLGAQSFDDRCLAALGRIHASGDIGAAVAELRAAGIDNFNLDLMYGLPEQAPAGALRDVERAIALEPAHISHYNLTLEPGTAFERRPPRLPDEDTVFEMQVSCQEMLAGAGYRQYEVSAYARPGRRCRHNLNYWEFGDYLGIGAGAHAKVTDAGSGRVSRAERLRQPGLYMAAKRAEERIVGERAIPGPDLAFEFCLNALRLVEGFDEAMFEARTGQPWATVPAVSAACERGLLERAPTGRWAATRQGRLFLNDLQAMFLPDPLSRGASAVPSP